VKQYVIDTNALISFVTDRNPEQQAKISKIFRTAAQLKSRILCPQNVLTEFIYVLDKVYGVSPNKIKKMIFDLAHVVFQGLI
jgi:predicted nucleic-acid-binding protein